MIYYLTVVVLICTAVQPSQSDKLPNIATEAGVDSLIQMAISFYRLDVDDDQYLSYDDYLENTLKYDLDHDKIVRYSEMTAFKHMEKLSLESFYEWDQNNDGFLSLLDFKFLFSLLPGDKKVLNLEDYLTVESSIATETKGKKMKIKAFVNAQKDFLRIDVDDDNKLTTNDVMVRYMTTNYNRDEKLSGQEILKFFPSESIPPKKICPRFYGCLFTDLLSKFAKANTNSDDTIDVIEYIRYFGFMIEV